MERLPAADCGGQGSLRDQGRVVIVVTGTLHVVGLARVVMPLFALVGDEVLVGA